MLEGVPSPAARRTALAVVATLAAAAALLPSLAGRVFLTTGRTSLATFAGLDLEFLVRCVERPAGPLPRRARVLLDRGPFTVAGERALLRGHRIDVLVTKDSGGPLTSAKLTAAREEGVRTVVVRRPPLPPGVDAVGTVDAALDRLRRAGASPPSQQAESFIPTVGAATSPSACRRHGPVRRARTGRRRPCRGCPRPDRAGGSRRGRTCPGAP
jgi:hypothetical protein